MTNQFTPIHSGPGGDPLNTTANLKAIMDHLGVTVRTVEPSADRPAEIALQFSGSDADALNRKALIFQVAWLKGECRRLRMPTY